MGGSPGVEQPGNDAVTFLYFDADKNYGDLGIC